MPTPKEHFDRLVKAKQLLQADVASITQLRQSKVRKRDSFESCMSTLLDLMKASKTHLSGGKAVSLKEQLKLKGHDPKLDVYYKMAKREIDDIAAFYAGELPPVVRRCKGNALAFRKALKELEGDVKQKAKGTTPEADQFRQLWIAWKTVDEKYAHHIEDAIDRSEKKSFDKSRALKKLEDDFAPKFNAFDAALTDAEL